MTTETAALISWQLSSLEKQLQQLKKIIQAKSDQNEVSLKGLIKHAPDITWPDFMQAEQSLFSS